MAKQQTAILCEARPTPPYWTVYFALPQPPAPGMFMLADWGGPLREALFPTALTAQGFATQLAPHHPALRLLPGTPVDMLGPFGHGFRLGQATRLLLIAEVATLGVVLPLLEVAPSTVLVLEAATRAQLPPADRFPAAVELCLVTNDGSTEYLGPLEASGSAPRGVDHIGTRLLELLGWTERVCLACDSARYPALASLVRRARLNPAPDFAQAWVRAPLPCGVGVCEICRIPTPRGERRVCVEGPVFDLLEF